jgi:hypothetical protein
VQQLRAEGLEPKRPAERRVGAHPQAFRIASGCCSWPASGARSCSPERHPRGSQRRPDVARMAVEESEHAARPGAMGRGRSDERRDDSAQAAIAAFGAQTCSAGRTLKKRASILCTNPWNGEKKGERQDVETAGGGCRGGVASLSPRSSALSASIIPLTSTTSDPSLAVEPRSIEHLKDTPSRILKPPSTQTRI